MHYPLSVPVTCTPCLVATTCSVAITYSVYSLSCWSLVHLLSQALCKEHNLIQQSQPVSHSAGAPSHTSSWNRHEWPLFGSVMTSKDGPFKVINEVGVGARVKSNDGSMFNAHLSKDAGRPVGNVEWSSTSHGVRRHGKVMRRVSCDVADAYWA